jgi:hypothetical protein
VAVRVEHHADVFLWLVVSQGGASVASPGHAFVEILDRNVEVHRHLLFAG